MVLNIIKTAIRNITSGPLYSSINILGLAIGMACSLLLLLYVQDELEYDSFHQHASSIYRLADDRIVGGKEFATAISSAPMGPAVEAAFPEVLESVRITTPQAVGFGPRMLVRVDSDRFYEDSILLADPTLFQVFSFSLVSGNPETALLQPNTVVISQAIAEKYFGRADPLGRILTFNEQTSYQVTGVFENIKSNSHIKADFFLSLVSVDNAPYMQDWNALLFYTYLLLAEGSSPSDLEDKLPDFLRSHLGAEAANHALNLQPLTSIHFHSHRLFELEQNRDITTHVYIPVTIAIFITLIACINFMNLTTARSAGRAKEVGVRKVLGAFRSELIGQFLGESLLLSWLALVLAVIVIEALLPGINALIDKNLEADYLHNRFFQLGLILTPLIVGSIAGSYPAFFLSAFKPVKVLKGILSAGSEKTLLLRRGLVILQFAFSIAMIAGTIVAYRQLDLIKNRQLGLNKDQVVVIPAEDAYLIQRYQAIKDDLMRSPNVLGVAVSGSIPGGLVPKRVFFPEGSSGIKDFSFSIFEVDHDFLDVLQLGLVEGRGFSIDRPSDLHDALIINQAAAERFGLRLNSRLVRQARSSEPERVGTVVGIVRDFQFAPLYASIDPAVLYINPGNAQYFLVKIAPQNIRDSLDFLSQRWREFNPSAPFDFFFLDEKFAEVYHDEELLSQILLYFSLLAIFVACLGLFGLASFATEQRTKEIGIRKVVGASAGNIFLLITRDFLTLVLLANLIGWPIAYLVISRWLQRFAYRIEVDLGVFLLAALLALLIALVTVSFQAMRAATANPVRALRYE